MYCVGMVLSLTDWPSRSRIHDHGFAAFAHSRLSRTWHETRTATRLRLTLSFGWTCSVLNIQSKIHNS